MSSIEDLSREFAKLPGIGRKTALRLTYHLLGVGPDQGRRLASALIAVAERVHSCERCFNLTEDAVCSICRDPRRDQGVICVVEEASDIGAIERAGEYRGVYHVLGGRLSPLDGVGPENLRAAELVTRVAPGSAGAAAARDEGRETAVREIIIATNPSLEGEATALYLQRQLTPYRVTVSRIARGIPVGGDLEYSDGVTIAQALSARREMK